MPCNINCMTCINPTNCTSCSALLFMSLDISKQCVCMTNFRNESGICVLNITCSTTAYYDHILGSCYNCN